MKNLFFFLFGFLIITSAYSQKSLTEGTVMMEVTDASSDDPQQAMMLESMKGSETEITFKGDKTAVGMSMMGGMVNMKFLTDKPTNQFNMLMDVMGQKMWVESALDATETAEQKEAMSKAKVEYNKEDKKVIAGYNCYAFKITNPDAEGMVTGYLTEEIKSKANIIQGYQSLEFSGFPMEFSTVAGTMKLTVSTKKVDEKADDKKFVLDTQGYKKMTMEEFRKQMGGMGGF